MKILVDADGSPIKDIVEKKAKAADIELIFIYDTAHVIESDYAKSIIVDKGRDSADFKLLSIAEPDDLIITQDYALASLGLSKNAQVLHPNGLIINNDNINTLLNTRYLNQKSRKMKVKVTNPKKRKQADNDKFAMALDRILDKK